MSWLYTIIFAGLVFASQGAVDPETKKAFEAVTVPAESSIQDETERFERSYPLNADGGVHVSNINGSITVEGWGRNEVKLEYTKKADLRERLADVEVKIDSRADYFSVETEYPNQGRNWVGDRRNGKGNLSVDIKLMVPAGAVIREIETVNGSVTALNLTNITRISAVNGTVKATGLQGTTHLSTVNGSVVADFERLEAGGKVTLETVNGSVRLTIPSDSNATLRADSLSGSITNDFGLPVRKGKYVGRDLRGRLGSGDTEIKLNSVNGSLSITRRNDGRPQSPSVNLLPEGSNDDADSSGINSVDREIRNARIEAERDIERAKRDIDRDRERLGELVRNHPDLSKIATETAVMTSKVIDETSKVLNSTELKEKIKEAIALSRNDLGRIIDIGFGSTYPRIETKTGSFDIADSSNIRINAEGCSIRVIGWSQSKVEYKVIQHTVSSSREPVGVNENIGEDGVTLNFSNPNADRRRGPFLNDGNRVTIEIYVPKRSNLTIESDSDIRVESISGKIELKGRDEPINIRDSDGSLQVTNQDGRIRLVGFKGEVEAKTIEGSINLEGNFSRLKAHSGDGSIVVTLPRDASAEISSNNPEVRIEGLKSDRGSSGERHIYKIGGGGAPFILESDGNIFVRSSETIRDTSR